MRLLQPGRSQEESLVFQRENVFLEESQARSRVDLGQAGLSLRVAQGSRVPVSAIERSVRYKEGDVRRQRTFTK